MSKSYYRPSEYAELWGVHKNTVYHWIRCGVLPGVKSVKVCRRRHHYIPVGVIPPRLFPGPKPLRRRVMPPDDMPPWEGPDIAPPQSSIEAYMQANQISIDQLTDEDWEVMASQSAAITADGAVK